MLLSATNPCPCGYGGERSRCRCGPPELARHRRRLSGPLLDRLDLRISLHGDADGGPPVSSARARAEVSAARERQSRRLQGEGVRTNAEMDASMLARQVPIGKQSRLLLAEALRRGLLSPRGEHRTLKVARTIADLAGRGRASAEPVAGALALPCGTPARGGRPPGPPRVRGGARLAARWA